MPIQTTAYISLKNIQNNVLKIRERIKDTTRIMGVVKADAYSHGVSNVATTLYKMGVTDFAVACLDEALTLRNILPDCSIMILGFTHPSLAPVLAKNNIKQSLYGLDFAKELSRCCKDNNLNITCHIAIDSGMGRIGFTNIDEAYEACTLDGIKMEGAFTHFSCADEDRYEFTKSQFDFFNSFTDELVKKGIEIKIRHCSNSAAIFKYPEFQLDMVRAGIVLYGLAPNADDEKSYQGILPVMQLRVPISHIKEVEKGATISYGAEYVAPKRMRVATVPCGYGDGYHRSFKDGYVLCCGKRAKILGRVCMDQFMIDVTDIPEARFLTPVTLFGTDGDETLSVNELAKIDGTINYQIVCDVSKRVIRVYE